MKYVIIFVVCMVFMSCSSFETTDWEQEYKSLAIEHDSLTHRLDSISKICEGNDWWKDKHDALSIQLDSSYWVKRNVELEEYANRMLELAVEADEKRFKVEYEYSNLYEIYSDFYDDVYNYEVPDKLSFNNK